MRRRKQKNALKGKDKTKTLASREKFILDNHMEKQVFLDAVALISKRLHLSDTEQELISPEDRIGFEVAPGSHPVKSFFLMKDEIDLLIDDIYEQIHDYDTRIENLFESLRFDTVGDIILIYGELNQKQRTALDQRVWGL